MPRPALFTLKWSAGHGLYELYEGESHVLQVNDTTWLDWLTTHTSFAFLGRSGRCNLLKEQRKQQGEGYWYAYRRQGKHTIKRYVGRSSDLTIIRLEEISHTLQDRASNPALLKARFQLPHLMSSLVPRERLFTLLDAGLEQRLTVLSAPAGSGKTTLACQWITTRRTRQDFPPVAWLTLEKSDNDPVRFWRYVMHACQIFQLDPGFAKLDLLSHVSSLGELPQFETILTHCLNTLTQSGSRGILVLEDYHVIAAPSIHKTMSFFLEHLPASVHPILITRNDPVLPLMRLRARGELCEVGANDLRFSHAEIGAFFQRLFPSLASTTPLQHVEAQLAGWAAGLRLFALTFQHPPTPDEFEQHLEYFVTRQHSLQNYIIEEVLNALNSSLQIFLLATCQLTSFTASLCDTVTGRHDSARQLAALERAGLFLEQLDGPGQWYRYHSLFADTLRAEALQRLGSARIQANALRASTWYEQYGMPTEAVEILLQAQAMDHAANCIERQLTNTGIDDMQSFYTLRRWLEQLPTKTLTARPLLCLCYAQILALSFAPGQPTSAVLDQMLELLQIAEMHWQRSDTTERLGEIYAFRAQIATQLRKQDEAILYARQALQWLPSSAKHWRGVALMTLGSGALNDGQLHLARTILHEALTIWTTLHHRHGARSCTLCLGIVYFAQGELQLAASCYAQVLCEARELGDNEDLIPALIGQAQLACELNDLVSAEQAAREAWDMSEQLQQLALQVRVLPILLYIWRIQGQEELARHHLSSLQTQLHAHPDLSCELQLSLLQFQLAEGDLITVEHALKKVSTSDIHHFQEQYSIIQAKLLLHQQKPHQARALLERLQPAAREAGRERTVLEIQLLIAQTYLAEQRSQEASDLLQTILVTAHSAGYRRLLLDQGPAMIEALQKLRLSIHDRSILSYLQLLLPDVHPYKIGSSINMRSNDPLSRQEQRVLRLLLAELTYPEIARELIVSVNTVKTQVRSIYHKLNVHNRRGARLVAQRLHLDA